MSFLESLKWYAVLLLVALVGGWLWGMYQHHEGVLAGQVVVKEAALSIAAPSATITANLQGDLTQKVQAIQTTSTTLLEKVPVYVTKKDDVSCSINNGFVQLWNDGNKMSVPASASSSDEEPSTVVLSDVAREHTQEAKVCTETEQQRDILRGWVLQQESLYNKGH